MKNIARLGTAVRLGNSADGMIIVSFEPFDGGLFELHPKQEDDGIFFVDASRPAAYGLYLRGDIDSLDRVQKALATIVRNGRARENGSDEE